MTTWGVVVGFFILFGVLVFWFRTSKPNADATSDSIVDVLTPVPVASSVVDSAIDLESSQGTLTSLSTNKPIGMANRGTPDGLYRITMNAALPEIDREKQFYEAWLVRKIPYDYISVGEFVTNDLGVFILEWLGKSGIDYRAYTNIVVTLQTKDGDPAPQRHVVEGEFGE